MSDQEKPTDTELESRWESEAAERQAMNDRNQKWVQKLAAGLVEQPNGCVEWVKGRTDGYGTIYLDGKNVKTHRVAWELANGPIPTGMLVCHHCDNPPCCNIDHLFLGTDLDNSRDKERKRRGTNTRKTHCPQGHEYTAANTTVTNRGWRECRTCMTEYRREWDRANRSAT